MGEVQAGKARAGVAQAGQGLVVAPTLEQQGTEVAFHQCGQHGEAGSPGARLGVPVQGFGGLEFMALCLDARQPLGGHDLEFGVARGGKPCQRLGVVPPGVVVVIASRGQVAQVEFDLAGRAGVAMLVEDGARLHAAGYGGVVPPQHGQRHQAADVGLCHPQRLAQRLKTRHCAVERLQAGFELALRQVGNSPHPAGKGMNLRFLAGIGEGLHQRGSHHRVGRLGAPGRIAGALEGPCQCPLAVGAAALQQVGSCFGRRGHERGGQFVDGRSVVHAGSEAPRSTRGTTISTSPP